ncbi:MAG: hypothetical protein WB777_24510 [Mycobacterium sp.]
MIRATTEKLIGELRVLHQLNTRVLAQRLRVAHVEIVEWITSMLAQEASGKPTTVQKAVGRLVSAANYPTRRTIQKGARTKLAVNEVEDAVHMLSDRAPLDVLLRHVFSDPAAVDALLRYTRNHRDCAGASSGIENQPPEVSVPGNGN